MGDVYRRVALCAISPDGKKRGCGTLMALVDTGSTVTVVPETWARTLGSEPQEGQFTLDKQTYKSASFEITLKVPGCLSVRRPIVVSDELATKAAPNAQMILGQDYLQPRRSGVILSTKGDVVACGVTGFTGTAPLRRRRVIGAPKKRARR